ncbi:MAG: glutathione S-transferase [Asticcacaulis sp.]
MLTALDIPFTEHLHWFQPDNSAFRSFSPSALVPALVDGDMTVWDSLAIAEYAAEDFPRVWPEAKLARAWARSATAEMHSSFQALRATCSMSVGVRVKLNDTPPALLRDLARIDALWSDGLVRFGGPYLASGAFTAADAFYAPVVFRIQTYGLGFHLGSAAHAYVDRMLAEPAMQAWYQAGLAETVRDAPHEVEIAAHGRIIEDLRAV